MNVDVNGFRYYECFSRALRISPFTSAPINSSWCSWTQHEGTGNEKVFWTRSSERSLFLLVVPRSCKTNKQTNKREIYSAEGKHFWVYSNKTWLLLVVTNFSLVLCTFNKRLMGFCQLSRDTTPVLTCEGVAQLNIFKLLFCACVRWDWVAANTRPVVYSRCLSLERGETHRNRLERAVTPVRAVRPPPVSTIPHFLVKHNEVSCICVNLSYAQVQKRISNQYEAHYDTFLSKSSF